MHFILFKYLKIHENVEFFYFEKKSKYFLENMWVIIIIFEPIILIKPGYYFQIG